MFTYTGVLAHSGRTDSSGCHTCRTNCSSWGLRSGEYHCHRSKGISQPSEPVRSHKETATSQGYTEVWNEYKNEEESVSSPYYKKTTPTKAENEKGGAPVGTAVGISAVAYGAYRFFKK